LNFYYSGIKKREIEWFLMESWVVFLIRDSYKKFAKAEKARQARIDLRVKESRHKIDVMDRVKPGEIKLDRKNPE